MLGEDASKGRILEDFMKNYRSMSLDVVSIAEVQEMLSSSKIASLLIWPLKLLGLPRDYGLCY